MMVFGSTDFALHCVVITNKLLVDQMTRNKCDFGCFLVRTSASSYMLQAGHFWRTGVVLTFLEK